MSIIIGTEKIDFSSLKFPIYKKAKTGDEFYRFDSLNRLLSVRKNDVIGIGVSNGTPESIFIMLYLLCDDCSDLEFNETYQFAMKEIISK